MLGFVPSLEDLQKEFARARELALEGSSVEVFDAYKNDFVLEKKPDLVTYARVLELESRVLIAVSAKRKDSEEDGSTLDVGVAELREILEGLEKNAATVDDSASA